mgnify:CR=1 FL=1
METRRNSPEWRQARLAFTQCHYDSSPASVVAPMAIRYADLACRPGDDAASVEMEQLDDVAPRAAGCYGCEDCDGIWVYGREDDEDDGPWHFGDGDHCIPF